jgi:2-amino-4-hydroxy-6-hydroxymethyldihydropteridine diphosphokinase
MVQRQHTHQTIDHSLQSINTNTVNDYARVAIGMGTNMEPLNNNLARATQELRDKIFTGNIATEMSSWYYSRACVPWGSKDLRPTEYINCVMTGSTLLTPADLLPILKEIEIAFGRDIRAKRWSPRPIDLDIIVYNNQPFESQELTIPHPRAIERTWVLAPLYELWPNAYVYHSPDLPMQTYALKKVSKTMESEPPDPNSIHHYCRMRTDIDVTTILEYYAGETIFEKIIPAHIVVKEQHL